MLRARIFSNYVTRTALQRTVMATAEAAAEAAATASGEIISFMREEDKKIRDRDVNKFVEQNRQYDPEQVFRRGDTDYGLPFC